MRLGFKVAVLLPLLLAASCGHKHQVAQNQPPLAPPIEDPTPPKPDNTPVNLPPAVINIPKPTEPTVTNTPPKPAPKHRKPKPTQPTSTDPQNPQVASNEGAPKVSAEGTFSTGDSSDLKNQTTNSIAETEKGLNDIKRTLNDTEQKTSAQIREFLKQAKAALNSGDVDGAHTLAQKAHVLLGELAQ